MEIIKIPQPIDTTITVKEFKSRFTGSEMRAIDNAALTDDEVYRYEKLVNVAQEIDLKHSDTISGVQYLVSIGILTQERAKEILRAS